MAESAGRGDVNFQNFTLALDKLVSAQDIDALVEILDFSRNMLGLPKRVARQLRGAVLSVVETLTRSGDPEGKVRAILSRDEGSYVTRLMVEQRRYLTKKKSGAKGTPHSGVRRAPPPEVFDTSLEIPPSSPGDLFAEGPFPFPGSGPSHIFPGQGTFPGFLPGFDNPLPNQPSRSTSSGTLLGPSRITPKRSAPDTTERVKRLIRSMARKNALKQPKEKSPGKLRR